MQNEHGHTTGREPGGRGALTNDRQSHPTTGPLARVSAPMLRYLIGKIDYRLGHPTVDGYLDLIDDRRAVCAELERRQSERDARRSELEREAREALAESRALRKLQGGNA